MTTEAIRVYSHETADDYFVSTSPDPDDKHARKFIPLTGSIDELDVGPWPYVEIENGRYLFGTYDYSPREGLLFPR